MFVLRDVYCRFLKAVRSQILVRDSPASFAKRLYSMMIRDVLDWSAEGIRPIGGKLGG